MGVKVVTTVVDQVTNGLLRSRVPDGLTPSVWVRLMVEILVSWPVESEAKAELIDLVENPYRGHGVKIETGPYRVSVRLREDHWSALETMAKAAGCSRKDYLRRLMYMGTMFPGIWWRAYKKEAAARTSEAATFV